MDRHLVAVEIGVVGRTDERVDLDCLALDQHRLEGLDAEAVKSRRTIQEHRVLLDHGLESVPHVRGLELDELLGHLYGGRELAFSSSRYTKGLKSSRAIFLGRPHWWSLSSGPTTMTERPE